MPRYLGETIHSLRLPLLLGIVMFWASVALIVWVIL